MSEYRVALRYARSIFSLSSERGIMNEIEADAISILKLCKTNHDFNVFLKSPVISQDKKWNIIKRVFGDSLHEAMFSFIHGIINKRRDMLIEQILMRFLDLVKESRGIVSATVTTASPMTEGLRTEVLKHLQKQVGSKLEIEERVDKDIIGGYILKFNDKVIDASVSSRLNFMKRHLLESN